MRSRSTVAVGAALGAVVLLAAGCLSEPAPPQAPDEPERETLEVMYPVAADLGDAFQEEIRLWAEESGVDVEFSPTGSIDELIAARVQGNDAPDVALLSQPAMVRRLAEQGVLLELSEVVPSADRDAMLPDLLAAGQVDDELYAVPVGVQVTSVVFYPRAAASEAAVPRPPATLAELRLLSAGIAATGTTPWCLGLEADDEAGWPAADWVETLMLVNHGKAVYDQWVEHEIPFDDPRVVDVLGQLETLLLEEGQTFGGREAIVDTEVDAAFEPMFTDPPGCYLYRHTNAVAQDGGFPEEVVEDIDTRIGVFPVPGPTADAKPVLGGAHLAGVLNQEKQEAQDLVRFLASAEFGKQGYAESGTWISPRRDFDPARYPSDTWRALAGIAHGATDFALDGSGQMPDPVGAGAFPRELTAWIEGEQDAPTTLAAIEEAWPEE